MFQLLMGKTKNPAHHRRAGLENFLDASLGLSSLPASHISAAIIINQNGIAAVNMAPAQTGRARSQRPGYRRFCHILQGFHAISLNLRRG